MQNNHDGFTTTECPVCGKEVIKRNIKGEVPYCSRVCKSQGRFSTRYKGTLAGPLDRPTKLSKTKL